MEPWHYIALLGAVVAVGALSMPRNKTTNPTNPSSQSVQNMETALEQFMENMEKDNEELFQMVAKTQADAKQEDDRKDMRIAALEQRCESLSLQLRQALDHLETTRASSATSSTAMQGPEPTSITAADSFKAAEAEGSENAGESKSTSVPVDPQPAEHSIASRYSELFRLYKGGKSIEAIAKKLGMNKGEVQLIIGLAKQEGASHV
ncbi:hypothetical protein RB620_07215 [Paenibacillus sp. LHD-117]|uniref:DUF6115 domain-containing protein n=1 Tax=Paenibacillus sp. LHD-117 TaxID=3071412 RepID=UPI0027DF49D7|nr:hypothetical protein [Paenibacillus sp. LHD-117]MDQ6419229.1 hypothetical protein [Paenibacillus sp. LHD-117]